MGRIRKFLALPWPQRWLLIKAVALLAAVRALVWVLPFPRLRPWLEAASRPSPRQMQEPTSPPQLAWAVGVAGRLVPGGGHCLSQALALQVFLMRRGHPCKLCFGVRRVSDQDFAAHAWLEHDGAVLIGGGELDRFIRLTSPADSPS